MSGLEGLGKLLIGLGGFILLLGLALTFAGRVPYLGRLPGDVFLQRDNVTIFLPLATMVVLSIVLSVLLNLVLRLFR